MKKLFIFALSVFLFSNGALQAQTTFSNINSNGVTIEYQILSATTVGVTDAYIVTHPEEYVYGRENPADINIPSYVINPYTGYGYDVTKLLSGAFSYNHNLTTVNIPFSIIEIGDYTFEYCENVQSIDIPSSVTKIGRGAFSHCRSMKLINIPEGIDTIKVNTFSSCDSLLSVNIPNSVTAIEAGAFANCLQLQSVSIPPTVTKIGQQAFNYCRSFKSLDIPSSVTEIDKEAFEWCDSIKTLSIGSGVDTIGYRAFANCRDLESIKMYPSAPPKLDYDVFYSAGTRHYPTPVEFSVPCGALSDYLSSAWWDTFKAMQQRCSSVTPYSSSALITWVKQSSAASYELIIYDADWAEISTYTFDADGNRQFAPGNQSSVEISYLVDTLTPNTSYYYSLNSYDTANAFLNNIWGSFITGAATSISEITSNAHTVLFGPNPVVDVLYFKPHVQAQNIIIWDIQGKKITENPSAASSINLSRLKSGIYIIEFTSEGEKYRQKLLKR